MPKRYTNFDPWDQVASRKPHADISDVVGEPPCALCKYWKPERDEEVAEDCAGIVICHAETMHSDFSCYNWKGNNQ